MLRGARPGPRPRASGSCCWTCATRCSGRSAAGWRSKTWDIRTSGGRRSCGTSIRTCGSRSVRSSWTQSISHLKDAGKPVNRNALARALHMQEAGTLQRIRQTITLNLRSGNLLLLSGNRIGLPAWKDRDQEQSVGEGS